MSKYKIQLPPFFDPAILEDETATARFDGLLTVLDEKQQIGGVCQLETGDWALFYPTNHQKFGEQAFRVIDYFRQKQKAAH